MKKLTFVLSLLVGIRIQAADLNWCDPVDHRKSSCFPKARSQSDSGLETAFAASELASFHLCQDVSAVALGLGQMKNQRSEKWAGGGAVESLIQIANEDGYCLEKELPSEIRDQKNVLGLKRAYESLLMTPQKADSCQLFFGGDVTKLFPGRDLADVFRTLSNDVPMKKIYAWADASCRNRIRKKLEVKKCEGDDVLKLRFLAENMTNAPVALVSKVGIEGITDRDQVLMVVARKRDEKGQCGYTVRDAHEGRESWISHEDLGKKIREEKAECFATP